MKKSPSRDDMKSHPFSRPFQVEMRREYPCNVDLTANPEEFVAIAEMLEIPGIAGMKARLTINQEPGLRFRVTGSVGARVTQICVVTLDPFEADVNEPVDIAFAAPPIESRKGAPPREIVVASDDEDPPEPIINGRIDLGAVACEFLALGLDPYPRKPGVAFAEMSLPRQEKSSPFKVLRTLRGDESDDSAQ